MTTTANFSMGTAITYSDERMETCTREALFNRITGLGDDRLEQETIRLRKLMVLDKSAYRTVKARLPYVVGGLFQDGIRNKEHFLSAHYFILDIDHITLSDGRVPENITDHVSVMMAFVSPGGEGIKIICPLVSPCHSPDSFTAAYKNYVSRFAEATGLSGHIDLRTSDATRACFLAYDPSAYYNPEAVPVDWQAEIGRTTTLEEEQPEEATANRPTGINEQAYKAVLKAINPYAPVRREKEAFVPEPLLLFQGSLEEICRAANLEPTSVQPIQYGLKVAAKQGYRTAEVNVFYGKRGFSIVKSPKTGIDRALTELLYESLYAHLFPPVVTEGVSLMDYVMRSN